MTKGRPPSKRPQPSNPADKLRDPKFLKNVKQSLKANLSSTQRAIAEAAQSVVWEPDKAKRRTGVDYKAEVDDVLRTVVYEQSHPPMPLTMRVRNEDHVSYHIGDYKTADCPLNYMHQRLEKKNRISDVQYAAGVRYRTDVLALARVGSNTAATIERLLMAPELTSEDRWKKLNGVEFMKGGDDVVAMSDPTNHILASVYRVRRLEDRLEVWERQIIREIVIVEKPIGSVAARWGIAPEAASCLIRMALYKLARVMENSDREFQAWLMIERQVNGEAKA